MPIKQITTDVTGLIGVLPRIVYINTTDTVATITTVGYLNHAVDNGATFSNHDMALVYSTDAGPDWYEVRIVGANTSLVASVNPGSVLLPVTVGHIATFTNVAGQIGDTNTPAVHLGNIQAGDNGFAGTFVAYPVTANQGTLIVSATNAGGAFNTTITNRARAQSTVMSFADVVSATGSFLVAATATPFTNNHLAVASGTGGLMADAGYQMKTVAGAVVAGGAAAQVVVDAFVTAASNIVASWNTQTVPAAILTVTPGIGQFTVTSTVDPGASTLNYIVTKV